MINMKALLYVVGGIAMQYTGISEQIFTLYAVLICFDILTGIFKQFRLCNKLTSKKFMLGLLTKIFVVGLIMLIAYTGYTLGYELRALVDVLIIMFAVYELISISENIYTISSGDIIENDMVTKFLKFIIGKLKNLLSAIMG